MFQEDPFVRGSSLGSVNRIQGSVSFDWKKLRLHFLHPLINVSVSFHDGTGAAPIETPVSSCLCGSPG